MPRRSIRRLDPTSYRAITREQWLLRETRLVARLRVDEGLSDDQIVERVQEENLFQYPTEHSGANIAGVCLSRLNTLDAGGSAREVAELIAHGTPEEALQANLYLLMRSYRLVREFMLAVIAPKFRSRDLALSRGEVAAFLNDLRQAQPEVSVWSDLTLDKCRQVLMKCLAEAGFIGPLKSRQREYPLAPVMLEPAVARAMHDNGDDAFLPAFRAGE